MRLSLPQYKYKKFFMQALPYLTLVITTYKPYKSYLFYYILIKALKNNFNNNNKKVKA
ncbi:uncharacterized protein TRIREDRAFT_112030 [Trichoderma reesei QM6a]|uniref:Predicted protein n=1 Tax=Hypocrea jecorina (strain QM6a) TaxID=431241 RepID=G0RW08_HYPJQ|nr:uncharacterized protein TRIREDRAFT_112030 [Trichoderma reesei QM6a]EGR44656.1 predicted protein [Trichoderma reesei QM6a]